MPSPFDARLVNGQTGDPALFVDLVHEGRAFLVDAGDLAALPPRKLLRVGDILVSHAHMDHWAGFDRFLRVALGREGRVRLFGPPGMMERVGHKLAAYTWNLVDGYGGGLDLLVTEVGEAGAVEAAAFRLRTGFAREEAKAGVGPGGAAILEEERFRVTAATLDHGIPCLAFAIEERAGVGVRRDRLDALGLGVGPWLRELKALALAGAPAATPVVARWREAGEGRERSFTLGFLREELLRPAPARKLAYVTDAGWTRANVERAVGLARGAEVLFVEAPFLDRDRERAAARRHLTARQAGTLARLAGVGRVVPFHFSPRHAGEEDALRAEVAAAFAGEGEAPLPEG